MKRNRSCKALAINAVARESMPRSVLIHPDECFILFVDIVNPKGRLSAKKNGTAARNGLLDLLEEAEARSVPVIATHCSGDESGADEREFDGLIPAENRAARTVLNPWKDKAVYDLVAAVDRNRLVLAGACAEGSLMQAALSALEDMYDVGILFDLSDPKLCGDGSPLAQRLIQAGVVPLTARQLLLEWAGACGEDDRDP